eukprot:8680402-Pyramimonas_sp.AAC.1
MTTPGASPHSRARTCLGVLRALCREHDICHLRAVPTPLCAHVPVMRLELKFNPRPPLNNAGNVPF